MKAAKSFVGAAVFLAVVYTLIPLAGIYFLYLRARGRIIVRGRLPRYEKRGVLVLPNHPSYLETILIPFLAFPGCLWHPFRRVPWSVPDFKNFLTFPHLFWLRYLHMIPVYRGNLRDARKNAASVRDIIAVLKSGGTVVLFAEGGRTSSGTVHRYSRLHSRELRPLEPTIRTIIERSGCIVSPVWVESTDEVLRRGEHWPRFRRRRITIRFGPEREFPVTVREIEDELLGLADRT